MKQGKKNLKPIPLAMRGKKRYIKFSAESEKPLKERDVQHSVFRIFLEKFGAIETAKTRLFFVGFGESKQIGIIRCSNKSVEEAKETLEKIKEISGEKVKVKVIRVSGTIKKLKA